MLAHFIQSRQCQPIFVFPPSSFVCRCSSVHTKNLSSCTNTRRVWEHSDNLHFPIALSTRFMSVSPEFCFHFPSQILHALSQFHGLSRSFSPALSRYIPRWWSGVLVHIYSVIHESHVKKAHTHCIGRTCIVHYPLHAIHSYRSLNTIFSRFIRAWKLFHLPLITDGLNWIYSISLFHLHIQNICELWILYGCAHWTTVKETISNIQILHPPFEAWDNFQTSDYSINIFWIVQFFTERSRGNRPLSLHHENIQMVLSVMTHDLPNFTDQSVD